jgi:hypothetical protein
LDDVAKGIVIHFLHDGVVAGIDDEPYTTRVIGDEAVGVAAFDHIIRDVAVGGVHKTVDDLLVAVEFGYGF